MMCKKNSFCRVRVVAVLLAGIFLVPVLRAQPVEPGRFLFIFETSSAMKSRVEGMQKALNAMLATSLQGQLHTGDKKNCRQQHEHAPRLPDEMFCS